MRTLTPNEFAIRLSGRELDGLFTKTATVEEGTVALLFVDRKYEGKLEPGAHQVGSDGIWALFGKSRADRSVVLLSSRERPVELTIPRLVTKDPLFVEFNCRFLIKLAPGGEVPFVTSLMIGIQTLDIADLEDVLAGEVKDIAQAWVGQRSIEELANNLELKRELTYELEAQLARTFQRYGLSFEGIELTNFKCAEWDKIKEGSVDVFLQISEREATLEGKKRLFDVYDREQLQEIAELTEKAALAEKRAQVFDRLRRAANSDRMNEITTRKEMEDFIRLADRDKLLKDHEYTDFAAHLEYVMEDNERKRAHLLVLADTERKWERERAELSGKVGLKTQEKEGEIGLNRLDKEWEVESRLKEVDLDVEKRRRLQELELELQDKEVTQEIRQYSDRKRAELDVWEREQRGMLDKLREEQKLQLERVRQAHQLEMEKMQTMDGLSIHNLISVSDETKAPLLMELAKTESMKNLSPEQILAMAAEKSPELGKSLAELAAASPSAEQKDFYEKLLQEQKEAAGQTREMYKDFSETTQKMFNKALETQSDVSKAFASGMGKLGGKSSGGASSRDGGDEDESRVVVCRKCQKESPVGTRFCANCGQAFFE